MEKRKFYILVSIVLVGISIFWLNIYAFIELEIDPFWKFKNNDTLTIKGNVKTDLVLNLEDIKSDLYHQIENQEFHFVNAIGRQFDNNYSGASLWSILIVEGILNADSSTFQFIGADGFKSPYPISLSLAEENLDYVIIAYECDNSPLFQDGPLMSIVDYSVIPNEATTHWAVKNLVTILIG